MAAHGENEDEFVGPQEMNKVWFVSGSGICKTLVFRRNRYFDSGGCQSLCTTLLAQLATIDLGI